MQAECCLYELVEKEALKMILPTKKDMGTETSLRNLEMNTKLSHENGIGDQKPLVTIYIPTKNRVDLLKRAINSVLDQDYNNIEIIVVDDNSNDGTAEYLTQLSEKNENVRYLTNIGLPGACSSRNQAILQARGEFITGLDDDDFYTPCRVSEFVRNWSAEEGLVGLFSDTITKTHEGTFPTSRRPKKVVREDLLIANYIGNQIFTKTSLLKEGGGFDTELPAWQDLECWYNLLSQTAGFVKKIPARTYVIDQSHPHERISDGRLDKIQFSYQTFVHKHKLNKNQSVLLESQMLLYHRSSVGLLQILSLFGKTKDFKLVGQLLKVYASPYVRKLKSSFYRRKKQAHQLAP